MLMGKKKLEAENTARINSRKARNQEMVFKAVQELARPVNGRTVAAHLGFDSASVTNRLAELRKKGRIKVAYRKKGLDGVWRQFYVVDPFHEANKTVGSQVYRGMGQEL